MRLSLGTAGLALAMLGGVFQAPAQVPEYKLKAELVERFTRFIEWPAPKDAGAAAKQQPFTICLFGASPFRAALEEMSANRKIKERRVVVTVLSAPAEVEGCQVLFVPAAQKDGLEKILVHTLARPILTVGDTEGFAERGVLVNFYTFENAVRFEINDSAARKSGLEISSRLLKLARIVGLEERP